jgi:CubicO group peptidase (beta-lactamase class C family)
VVDDSRNSRFLRVPALVSGGGGMLSTAPDYARFCQMLLNRGTLDGTRILAASSVGEMTRNQLPPSAYPISFSGKPWVGVGFGLGFSVVVEGDRRHGEYGWSGAAGTHFWISPMDNLFVITLSQDQPFNLKLAQGISALVYAAVD